MTDANGIASSCPVSRVNVEVTLFQASSAHPEEHHGAPGEMRQCIIAGERASLLTYI
jgi:hypothetical protein